MREVHERSRLKRVLPVTSNKAGGRDVHTAPAQGTRSSAPRKTEAALCDGASQSRDSLKPKLQNRVESWDPMRFTGSAETGVPRAVRKLASTGTPIKPRFIPGWRVSPGRLATVRTGARLSHRKRWLGLDRGRLSLWRPTHPMPVVDAAGCFASRTQPVHPGTLRRARIRTSLGHFLDSGARRGFVSAPGRDASRRGCELRDLPRVHSAWPRLTVAATRGSCRSRVGCGTRCSKPGRQPRQGYEGVVGVLLRSGGRPHEHRAHRARNSHALPSRCRRRSRTRVRALVGVHAMA